MREAMLAGKAELLQQRIQRRYSWEERKGGEETSSAAGPGQRVTSTTRIFAVPLSCIPFQRPEFAPEPTLAKGCPTLLARGSHGEPKQGRKTDLSLYKPLSLGLGRKP